MSRLSTRQYNAKSGMEMPRKLYAKIQLKVLSCELMLKMTELLDRSKHPHVWNCWGLKYLKSVWCSWGTVGVGMSCLHQSKGRVGTVSGKSAGCMPRRAGEMWGTHPGAVTSPGFPSHLGTVCVGWKTIAVDISLHVEILSELWGRGWT